MARETRPRESRLTADQRIYNLGYQQGCKDGHLNGALAAEAQLRTRMEEGLRILDDDLRLGLHLDAGPRDIIQACLDLLAEVDYGDDDPEAASPESGYTPPGGSDESESV